MNKGIKLFGTKGTDAVETNLRQLHNRKVIKPVPPADLSKEQKWKSLAYLMFIKEKRCGKIKGRGCADGRKQRGWIDKEDTSSPTVSTQALMLSCMIDTEENRDVATADIPGAFLQTDNTSGSTDLKMEGIMVDILLDIDKDRYEPFVVTRDNGSATCMQSV